MSTHRHWLWLLAARGYYRSCWSPFIIGELVRIRVERALHFDQDWAVYRERVNNLVHVLSDVFHLVNHRGILHEPVLRDPDDDHILATALAARASYVISLNTTDFPEGGSVLGVRFLTPQEFLTRLEELHRSADPRRLADEAGRQIP